MPIPALNADGHLPIGVFDCSLAEVRARFGSFQGSDIRPRHCAHLEELIVVMQRSKLFKELLIDGSFVTSKPSPNDIDLVAVLHPGHDFERDLPMSEYALVSRNLLRRRFGFDIIVAEGESQLYKTYVEFFSRVRSIPTRGKDYCD